MLYILLAQPTEGTNLPHLITLRLDLARTKSKYPYFNLEEPKVTQPNPD